MTPKSHNGLDDLGQKSNVVYFIADNDYYIIIDYPKCN